MSKEEKKAITYEDEVNSYECSAVNVDQIGAGVSTGPVTIDREEYLTAQRELTYDKIQLQIKNNILMKRLSEYYKKRKLEHVLKPLENSSDLEEKYEQKLFAFQELKEKGEREIAGLSAKVREKQSLFEQHLERAVKIFEELQTLERSTGNGLIYSKKGKPIAQKTVERYLTLQRQKTEQMSKMCLRYIRARNAVNELEAVVKRLELIGPGLYVAQFEQLFIDNQNLSNKIEEREDELIKNRAKCTEHSQILAHIREKMHHTEEVIDFKECDLGDAEIECFQAREELGYVKNKRDRLRWSVAGERAKAGLLTRKDLLRDYQNATDQVKVEKSKKKHLEDMLEVLMSRIREARRLVEIKKEEMDEFHF